MQHDLFGSGHDLDQRSNLIFKFYESYYTSFDASWTPKIYVNDFTTIVFSSSRRVEWCIIWHKNVKNDVTRAHQRSNFTVVWLRPTFPDKWHRSSWTIRVSRARKKHSIAHLQIFPYCVLRFDLRSTVWPPEAMKGQNGRILKILFFYHNFEPRKSMSMILPSLYSALQDTSNDM